VVEVGYAAGVPVSVDGKELGAIELVTLLNKLGGKHGVGRVDITENRLVGMKSRGVYETPGGTIILEGLRTLRALTLDRDTHAPVREAHARVLRLVYTGAGSRRCASRSTHSSRRRPRRSPAKSKVRSFKGTATAIAATSPFSLYSESLATFARARASTTPTRRAS
jgi:argininosuccinate synthase